MNDLKYSKKQLLEQIEVLQILNKQILEEKHQAEKLEFAWSGNLGHWYFHLKTKTVIFNPLKIQVLGYTQEELPDRITYNFFTDKLHPEDYGKTMLAMKLCMEGKTEIYECEYRIQDKNGNYKWFYDRGKITQWDDHGNPILVAGIVFDITERKMQEQLLTDKTKQLEMLSSTDVLTGIHNRRSIMEILELKMKQVDVLKLPLSVAMFDIDLFKKINDKHGHQFGDLVIQGVAKTIVESIRETDFAGRYGGEEYLVILPNTDLNGAMRIAERIRSEVELLNFQGKVHVTISGGVAQFSEGTLDQLIQQADQKLYEAKKSGRNIIKGNLDETNN